MGLTKNSGGINAIDRGLNIQKQSDCERIVALAGNPNVGKSSVFNALTGMKQHTGNWPGKTVSNAMGMCSTDNYSYIFVDIPGTYSLMAHSAEEEVARNFICFGNPDYVVVVCDATCLERNLNLVLQTMEISDNVIVCVNLMDEARRKNIRLGLDEISLRLGVPVVPATARRKTTLSDLLKELDRESDGGVRRKALQVEYPEEIETAVSMLEPIVREKIDKSLSSRWVSLKLLENDKQLNREMAEYFGSEIVDGDLAEKLTEAQDYLASNGISSEKFKNIIVSTLVEKAESICRGTITYESEKYSDFDRHADRILTSRLTGYPVMILLLAFVFWLTVCGANYPSQLLSDILFYIQDKITELFIYIGVPPFIHGALVLGVYRVLAWVVSVMLPPMAIFFPLFTLLEDSGYLPRIAYNLDKPFKKCCACGKQALTMCMGFGCNAAGIVGCRIIDSPRERLLAMLTNSFVPCNGRFPMIISIIAMFFVAGEGLLSSVLSAAAMTVVILIGIAATFAVTKLLSGTVLKGVPSSFTLELPPYRRPQIGRVVVSSIFDRTIFVLGRAAAVAAPAGLVIWLLANAYIGDKSILNLCAGFLDPFARIMGLDGAILIAFILGFPANEIVVPIIIMEYMASGSISELASISEMKQLFIANGWTNVTAVCTVLFSLLHWPCSTTLLTIKKETGSVKWTVLSALIPTAVGIALCTLIASVSRIFL